MRRRKEEGSEEGHPGKEPREFRGLGCLSLLGVLLLAKTIVLVGRDGPASIWSLVAFVWQDVLVVLLFALVERVVQRTWFSWTLYGAVVLYIAINVPLTRLLSSPMTWTMMRAARGTLADSIRHHLSWANAGLMLLVIASAIALPFLFNRRSACDPRKLTKLHEGIALAFGLGMVALGPLATTKVETDGLHRNALVALVSSTWPKVQAEQAENDWRRSPFGNHPAEDLTRFRGAAAGRNVVLILLESTGAEHLKLYGAAEDPTPNLTALAAQSILFENAYAVYPESIKGLFSVICSHYPAFDTKAEIYAQVKLPSLAEVFAQAGYRTALFHSGRFMYLGMESIVQNRGFQTLEDAGGIGGNHNSSFGVDEPAAVQRILGWLDLLAKSEKFFITYLPIAGHHPYLSPAGGPFPETNDLGRYRNALHDGDAALGELIQGLRTRNIFQNTLFFILGDHGEAFGQHEGNFGHTLFIHEENVRVPYLIAAPGLFQQQEHVQRAVSLIDTAPSILDLVGLKTPVGYQGQSLLAASDNMALFYTDYSLGFLGLRDGCWKFIYELESGRSKLFDLCLDPQEKANLAVRHPDRVEAYRRHLKQWSGAQKERIFSAARGKR
jgi:arylsulfatase A-like enzyme